MSRKASLAKISRPRLFGVVPRERLFALLDDNRGRPLIWISSPPGAGKTALVASYLEHRGLPAVWYQIDAGDADPATLFHYLSRAAEALATVDSVPLPRFDPEHLADLPNFARLYFRVFFSRLPEPLILVFDNYQEAPEDALLDEILRHAVSEVPLASSILAISREEAPRDFVRFAARGLMTQLGWDNLQLSLDEVRALAAKRSVSDDWLIKALHHQSQGWAAGITLMLERLGHFDGKAQELPSDTREAVFNYFASLIFDQASDITRHILLSIAFLPHVSPSLGVELSGRTDTAALLEDLYRRRMFTDRRPGAEPVYQFHALFLDFLRTRARTMLGREEIERLLIRSAIALENAAEFGAAMEIWLDTESWEDALRVLLKEAKILLHSGRRQTLLLWISRIPEARRRTEPWLLYWLGSAQLQIAPEQGLRTLQSALEQFQIRDDQEGRIECLVALLDGAFLGFHALDAMSSWLDELLMEIEIPNENVVAEVELHTWGVLGMALFHVRPWHPMMPTAYRRIEQLLPQCADSSVALVAAMHALVVAGLCGDFERGNRIARATETLASQNMASPSEAAWWFAQVGWLKFVEARYEEALDFLEKGRRIAEDNDLRAVLRQILLWRYTIEWRTLGWPTAISTLEKINSIKRSIGPMTEAQLHLFRSRSATHRGEKDEAARLASLSQQAADKTGSRLEELIFCHSNADVLMDSGRIAQAGGLLLQSRTLIERAAVYQCWEAAQDLLEARLAHEEGKLEMAVGLLGKALALARRDSQRYYLRFADWAMPPLFELALRQGVEVDLVRDLIRMFRLKPPINASDLWPWGVRIETLGRFEVRLNGEPMEFSRKLPRKTLLLLKAIIALGGRDVPEQVLCDTLWADEEGDAAHNALSITVLRLRKLLGSNDAVIHQGGKVSLNAEICWVDAWAFEARLADAGADIRTVLELYDGRFLPEDEGESWSVAPRERLRGKFIDALSRHGGTLEAQGDLPGAIQFYLRGIDADPVVESFHQGLMRCYECEGKRTEALSVYRRLKHTLSVVLGVPPSDVTQRLFQDMLQRQSVDGETRADDHAGNGAPPGKSGIVTKMPQRRAR